MDVDYFANHRRQGHIARDVDLGSAFTDNVLHLDALFILSNRLHKNIFLPPSAECTL